MSVNTHIFSSSKRIFPYITQLHSVTDHAISLVENLISIGDIDLVFYDNPDGVIREFGIGGYTPSANIVFMSLDPQNSKFEESLKNDLLYMLIHEFHHAIRFRTPIPKDTLLEAMVSEGLADHFAMEVTGINNPPIWSKALTDSQEKELLTRASKEWNNAVYDHSAWFYGTKSDIPRWAGYTLAFNLVSKYLKNNPSKRLLDIISINASEMIP